MKKAYLVPLCYLLLMSTVVSAQAGKGNKGGGGKGIHKKWRTNPFDHQLFIQNMGQFDTMVSSGSKVLYGAQLGGIWAYFTRDGIIYRYAEYPKPKDGDYGAKYDRDEDGIVTPTIHYFNAAWNGASASPTIEASMEQSYSYTYPIGAKGTITTHVFKKLTYKNIYPGIDVEYVFPAGRDGFKYSVIAHPGSDLSQVKLKYDGASEVTKESNGDVKITTLMKDFTDHAPVSSYTGSSENIPVSFNVAGNVETFVVNGEYDKTKDIVIDPWVTNPLFTGTYNRAYDIDYDYNGNVYAYGSWGPLQFVKLNSVGAIQWTYNATALSVEPYYGDFATDKKTGTSYLTEGFGGAGGAKVQKINTFGNLLATYPGTDSLNEMWRAVYNACYDNIIIGAGGVSSHYQACMLDTNLVHVTPVDYLSATEPYHDIVLIAVDPSGLEAYMGTAHSALDNLFNDVVSQLPLPALSPPTYMAPDNFNMPESNVAKYVASGGSTANGFNGMDASPNWLYVYNGESLKRMNKATGVIVDSIPVSNTTARDWSGLVVDPCDDVFVGCRDSVKYYDNTLTLQGSITMSGTVYDLTLGQNNVLLAAEDGWVEAVSVPAPAKLISTASGSPSSCSACNGTASVNINCGVAPFHFLWSNGSTDQTDTGLCAGLYTVTVTDASCPPRQDTAIVDISGKVGYGAIVKDTNPNCAISKGNIIVFPFGGSSPYTYAWSNGETNQKDTGLSAGIYVCTITDSAGCRYAVSVTLVNPVTPTINITPRADSICLGSSVPLVATGVKAYTWTPNSGLTCYNCPNPTATPTSTTTYTVNGVDSNGCTATTTTTIKVYPVPIPVIKGMDSICAGNSDTLTVSGGTKYVWSNAQTSTSIIVSPNTTKTITVTAYNGSCSHDTSFTIHVVSPSAAITASKDSTCAGDTVKLTAIGGTSYKWSTSGTSKTIIVSPTAPTTYTLYTAYGTCKDSATVTIGIIKSVTAAVSVINDTVCPNGTTTITANSSGGQATYLWSNGATTSSITVSDTATTTYTAAVTGKCNTVPLTQKVVVVPLAKPIISGTSVKCKGVKDTLTVSGGTGYLWSNGKTTTNYFTGAINADSTIKVYAFNSLGCKDSTSFKITVRTPPIITITPPTAACAGSDVLLTAKATGTGPFTYSWSPGGATTDTITVNPISATTYTVVVSNGCKSTKTTVVTPSSPSITACCSKTIVMGDDTTIVAYGDSLKSYSWNPSVICLNPPLCDSVKVTPTITTTYTVTGTDSKGCQVSHIVTITVETPCFDFVVPNVITPNDPGPQGLNGMFYIKTTNLSYWSLVIFDRWGKEIYKSNNPNEYWTGTTEGGSKATDGVYYYIINATCQGNSYKKDGFLQLIR